MNAEQPTWHALDTQQINDFDAIGYTVLPRVLDAEQVAVVTAACDSHMSYWGPRTQDDFPRNYYANRYMPYIAAPDGIDASSSSLYMYPRESLAGLSAEQAQTSTAATRALVTNPRILSAVVQLMHSADIQLSHAQLTYKFSQNPEAEPTYADGDGKSHRNWHRDLNNFGPHEVLRGKAVTLRVGIALTDMDTPDSGVTMLVPGSHKWLKQIAYPEHEIDPKGAISPTLKAGDALCFWVSCYHTPAINTRPQTAKLLLMTYSYRVVGAMQEPPPQEILATLTPLEQQLFGKRWLVNFGGQPLEEGDRTPLATWAKELGGFERAELPMRLTPTGAARL